MSIPPPSTNPTSRAFPAEPLSPPRAQVPGTPPPQWYSYSPAAWADADAAADPSADPYSGQYLDDDDDESGGAGGEWVWARRASGEGADLNGSRETLEAEVRLEDSDQAAGSYMLFCGGDLPDSDSDYEHNHDYDYDHDHPAHPAPSRRRASAFGPAPAPARRGSKPRRTNGCGALVHTVALPRRRHGVWIARGTAGLAVGPMDAEYFDCKAIAKMMQSACGCIREGVGCRVCRRREPLHLILTIYHPPPLPRRPFPAAPLRPLVLAAPRPARPRPPRVPLTHLPRLDGHPTGLRAQPRPRLAAPRDLHLLLRQRPLRAGLHVPRSRAAPGIPRGLGLQRTRGDGSTRGRRSQAPELRARVLLAPAAPAAPAAASARIARFWDAADAEGVRVLDDGPAADRWTQRAGSTRAKARARASWARSRLRAPGRAQGRGRERAQGPGFAWAGGCGPTGDGCVSAMPPPPPPPRLETSKAKQCGPNRPALASFVLVNNYHLIPSRGPCLCLSSVHADRVAPLHTYHPGISPPALVAFALQGEMRVTSVAAPHIYACAHVRTSS
ncbi:hypothetical protein HETIRDRAFT_432852 [Heterobasidion irregulare TC 32-1]|uniref:Uncharacterized protein n=1 Tax=Heterobasidion irregulare (strain TC 32-1) TaxID=747525 RepID=W4KFD3_HETIT|nr:uncharacterized protein HETIRDRAFT_432852 [Heterobasidion irregulare TC 32-1]ETW83761.1 hypothetical protein HETIRDRAFT_432852 [Heterobasidion irregulare TC 32-1]